MNSLAAYGSQKDFIAATDEKTKVLMNAINDFKAIKDEALSAIDIIKSDQTDAQGNPVFNTRAYEVMEKFYKLR